MALSKYFYNRTVFFSLVHDRAKTLHYGNKFMSDEKQRWQNFERKRRCGWWKKPPVDQVPSEQINKKYTELMQKIWIIWVIQNHKKKIE